MAGMPPELAPGIVRKTIVSMAALVLTIAILAVAGEVLLLIFAGVLLAVLLGGLADWFARWSSLPYGWSLAAVGVLLAGGIALGIWQLAPSIAVQFDQLTTQMPRSVEKLKTQLQSYSWAQSLLEEVDPKRLAPDQRDILSRATGIVSGFLGAVVSLVVILFIGLYGAAEPDTYRNGLVALFPPARRERIGDVLREVIETLRWWLIGKFISMAIVGVLTAFGLWLLDVPLALILAFIAAVLTFIPNLGPILAAVPAILFGLLESPMQALYIAFLYLGIQTVESYVITPLIQRQTILVPPGLTLGTQVILGVLFGAIGVALATPLTAAGLVAAKRFYLEDVLGDVLRQR